MFEEEKKVAEKAPVDGIKINDLNQLVHPNSCKFNQDIASSGTNSQIGTLARMFRWEAK